jgi:hypothetical protein
VESTNQVAQTAVQPSSPMQTSVAQPSAAQYATSQPQTFQASPAPQAPVAPQAPAYQAAAPVAQPSAGNPWQEAFQALSASLNTSSPSQTQVPYSAYQTPTPQASTQANWASTQPQHQAQYSAAPTYSPQASTQAYAQQQMQAQVAQQAERQVQAAPAADAYLSQISDQSLEVLEHFGAEAPALLNQYACAVEDALIEQVQRGQSNSLLLKAAGEERAAMNLMLTNPDVLADYVNEFFGPNGPYPTETTEETAARQQYEARAQFEAEIEAQEKGRVPQSFNRPEMTMPTPGRNVNASQDFWGGFSEMMDNNPEQAWQYLAQAPQGALSAKMLVQDV